MELQLPDTIWVASEPVNLRLSFDRLAGVVRQDLEEDPKAPVVVLFYNKRQTHIKLLWHNGRGYCVYHQRLDRGTFTVRVQGGKRKLLIDASELQRIIRGAREERIKELRQEVASLRARREEMVAEARRKGWLGDR